MPQVKYTADGLPYYDATDHQTQPYFPQVSGPMLPAPGNPAQPSEGWNQGVRDTLHGMTIGPVQDAAKALQGGMTDDEAQNFAFGAALGLLPMGRGLRPATQGIRAYHGSPHDFDRFDMSKIGAGEGAQSYGHGLYFADTEDVAKSYRDMLAKPGQGRMYEVNINASPENFIDWDAPLAKQPKLEQTIRRVGADPSGPGFEGDLTGAEGYRALQNKYFLDQIATRGTNIHPDEVNAIASQAVGKMAQEGIPGIKYLDQGSRTAGDGSRNYVVFDDKLVSIIKKYGWAAIAPMLGLTAENLPIPKAQAPQFQ